MNNITEYNSNLKRLLLALNISGSKLAKAINIDPSLVNRWVNNRRAIPSKSDYIDRISDYLSKVIITPLQEKKVIEILCELKISYSPKDSIRDCIYRVLTIDRVKNDLYQYNCNNNIQGLIENVKSISQSDFGPLKSNKIYSNEFYEVTNFPCTSARIEILNGHENILRASLKLLSEALNINKYPQDSILSTIDGSLAYFSGYENFHQIWNVAIMNILKNDWDIVRLLSLDNNTGKTLSVINSMLNFVRTGKYHINYYKKYNISGNFHDLLIIPHVGALLIFENKQTNSFDSAFLFKDNQSIGMLTKYFNQMLLFSLPLVLSYPCQRETDFQMVITKFEEMLGSRYAYKDGLSTITIPLDLYKKYLYKNDRTCDEVLLRISYHKRRLDAFYKQVEYYKYIDICTKSAVERLIQKGEYSFDEYYLLENKPVEICEVVKHLENVVYMLENYQNYEIVLVDDTHTEDISKIYLMIKQDHSVIIETCNSNRTLNSKNKDMYDTEVNLSISEATVVNAFQKYFIDLLEEISPVNRDKNNVISWFKNHIKNLNKGAVKK